jgi:thiamine transport system permease protein
LAIFFVYPLGSILERSLGGESGFGFDPFKVLLNDSYYLGRIWFTVWQAVVSTLLTLAVGLPAAFLFARYEFPGKTLLKAISTLPFVMPTIVVAMGFTALFGSQGIVNSALESMFGLDEPPVRISNSLTIIFMAGFGFLSSPADADHHESSDDAVQQAPPLDCPLFYCRAWLPRLP